MKPWSGSRDFGTCIVVVVVVVVVVGVVVGVGVVVAEEDRSIGTSSFLPPTLGKASFTELLVIRIQSLYYPILSSAFSRVCVCDPLSTQSLYLCVCVWKGNIPSSSSASASSGVSGGSCQMLR
jgi:hypothetical protein